MIEIRPEIITQVMEQQEKKPGWAMNETAQVLDEFILEEAEELGEAIQKAMIGDSPFETISELGDIAYLYVKRCQLPDQIPDEVNAAWDYCNYVAELTGVDLNDAVYMKLWRNEMKYPEVLCNDTNRVMGTAWSKLAWEAMGGDKAFSLMYEQYPNPSSMMNHFSK